MNKVSEYVYTTDMQEAIAAAEEQAKALDTRDPDTGQIKVTPIQGEWRSDMFWDKVFIPSQYL